VLYERRVEPKSLALRRLGKLYYVFHNYVVYLVPTQEGEKPVVIIDLTIEIAKDQAEVNLRAARKIPAEYENRLDEVVIAVRPF